MLHAAVFRASITTLHHASIYQHTTHQSNGTLQIDLLKGAMHHVDWELVAEGYATLRTVTKRDVSSTAE